jgi:hypothetical protein
MIEDILAELKKISRTLEIHGRMLETLIDSEDQRRHASQSAKMDVSNQVSGVFAMLQNNPIFKDNPELLNMFEGFNSAMRNPVRNGEEK